MDQRDLTIEPEFHMTDTSHDDLEGTIEDAEFFDDFAQEDDPSEFIPTVKDTNPKDAIGSNKAPLSTVPMPVMFEVGTAMLEGACKYARHNYRVAGVRSSVYFDATQRHLAAWWEGEDIDPDSGMSHITKAIASLVVLRDAQINRMVANDDRPPRAREGWLGDVQAQTKGVLSRYPNPLPPYTQEHETIMPVRVVQVLWEEDERFEVSVQLPMDGTVEGMGWFAQGTWRPSLEQAEAVAQALRLDGYAQRVLRIRSVQAGRELMSDGTSRPIHRFQVVRTIFPGDSLPEVG